MIAQQVRERSVGRPKLPLERVHVELTNVCDFTCEYCPNRVMSRPKGQMEPAVAKTILEEIARQGIAPLVLFHQQGEPTLHRGLADAVRAASLLGLATCVTTNGSRLTDRLADALLDAGLSHLVISVQTPDEAGYLVRGRRSLHFARYEERVVGAVRRILASSAPTVVTLSFLTRAYHGLSTPTSGSTWRIVARDDELRRLLTRWAARALDCSEQRAVGSIPALSTVGVNRRFELQLAARLALEARPAGEWVTPLHPPGRAWSAARFGLCHCQGLNDHFAILWDGRYSFCCADHDGRTSTARYPETSLLEFLESAEVREATEGFEKLRPVNPYCRMCLGGPSRGYALAKSLGSLAYFGVLRRQCCAMEAAASAPTAVGQTILGRVF